MMRYFLAVFAFYGLVEHGYCYCAPPKKNQNSHVSPIRIVYSAGSTVTYRCDPGCWVEGPATRRCVYSYSHRSFGWTNNKPRCTCPPRHCPTPRFPLHGFIYAMKPSSRHFFSVGDSILYRCSYGYKLDSNPKVYCHVSGWSHTPKCLSAHQCLKPTSAPQNMEMNYSNNGKVLFQVGEWISYTCNPGYCLIGPDKSFCQPTGWSKPPICKRGGCTFGGLQRYGSKASGKTQWCPGEKAQFKCGKGFRLVGSSFTTCGVNNQWKQAIPRCIASSCVIPPSPKHGWIKVNPAGRTALIEGQFFTYGCKPDFCRYGNSQVFCYRTGWSHMPKCKRACPSVNPPLHGSLSNEMGHRCPGSILKFTCDKEHVLVGSKTMTCQDTGQWSAGTPACSNLCKIPNAPKNGWIFVEQPHQVLFEEGQFFTYGCQPGYCRQGTEIVRCSSGGWTHKMDCHPACPQLTVPAFGSYARNAGLRCPGNVVAFQCNAEYALVGQEALTCDASSRWSHPVPVCAKSCPLILAPETGFVIGDSLNRIYSQNETISLSCQPQFCMRGEPNIYCRQDGWTTFPTCMKGCPLRELPRFVSYVEKRPAWCPGEEARFVCEQGYQIIGSDVSLCGDDRLWNTELPSCQTSVACVRPNDPLNGFIASNPPVDQRFALAESVIYICQPGYCLTGGPTVVCESFGWSHVPQCLRGCRHRPPPLFGLYRTNRTVWCPGDSAFFACQPGYQISGSAVSECMGGGLEWSHPLPSCEAVSPVITERTPPNPFTIRRTVISTSTIRQGVRLPLQTVIPPVATIRPASITTTSPPTTIQLIRTVLPPVVMTSAISRVSTTDLENPLIVTRNTTVLTTTSTEQTPPPIDNEPALSTILPTLPTAPTVPAENSFSVDAVEESGRNESTTTADPVGGSLSTESTTAEAEEIEMSGSNNNLILFDLSSILAELAEEAERGV